MKQSTPPLQIVIIILGPTASGKTSLAVRLASRFDGEIISADSRQVYRKMDIGTGKDLSEYGSVPYHLIDIRPAGAEYSVSDFQKDTLSALADIKGRRCLPIICGGTGHYVKALLEDYTFTETGSDLSYTNELEQLPRFELYNLIKELGLWETHHWASDSTRRMARAIEKKKRQLAATPPDHLFTKHYDPYSFYIELDREVLIGRIEQRLRVRLDSGLIDEVENLLAEGVSHQRLERYGLEYRWASRYLRGDISVEELFEKLAVDIRRYAKRQMTFIRYLQKNGHLIRPISDPDQFLQQMETLLKDASQQS